MLALAGVWMAAFAIHAGCDSSSTFDIVPGVSDAKQEVLIEALFAKSPMFVVPDAVSQRTNYIDVASQVPIDGDNVTFELPADSVTIVPDANSVFRSGDISIDLVVSRGNGGPGRDGTLASSLQIEVESDGTAQVLGAHSPLLGHDLVTMLGDGIVGLDIIVKGNFRGVVLIDGTKIRIGIGTGIGGGNSNDNSSGNANDNTGDNGNDNTDPNGNDNTAPNGNDNTAPNGNDNTDPNGNDNTAPNGNDNTDPNGNDNTDPNGNDNTAPNGNDNTDPNGNDNTGGSGICSDGSTQLRVEVRGPGDFEVEARYSENGPDCRRFRLDIAGFVSGWYDVFVNDVFVGEIFADSSDGEGRLRLETDDGNFPADFPDVMAGDVVSVGDVIDVTLQPHCSELFSCGNMNGNDNTGGNTNDNGAGNTNDNGAGNTNDNGA